ncbi:MAG: 50S ribosomal protein L9 [Spirochaetia bacterium]|nr:50S ribosomal protein L9 [Spirochaetia bacterium]
MKIILNQDVINLGEEGDVVVVKDGYARNYLLPQGIAVVYNRTNMAIVNSRAKAIEVRKIEKRKASASLKEKLDELTLTLVVSAGDTGKLFGSVTSSMIQEALAKEGIEVEKKKIEVASHMIKMVGNYSVRIHLYEKDFATIKIVVESEAQIKQRQAEEKKVAEKAAKEAAQAAKELASEETAPVTE